MCQRTMKKRNCFDLVSALQEREGRRIKQNKRARVVVVCTARGDRITCFNIYHSLIVWCHAGIRKRFPVRSLSPLHWDLFCCNDMKRAQAHSLSSAISAEFDLNTVDFSLLLFVWQFASISNRKLSARTFIKPAARCCIQFYIISFIASNSTDNNVKIFIIIFIISRLILFVRVLINDKYASNVIYFTVTSHNRTTINHLSKYTLLTELKTFVFAPQSKYHSLINREFSFFFLQKIQQETFYEDESSASISNGIFCFFATFSAREICILLKRNSRFMF